MNSKQPSQPLDPQSPEGESFFSTLDEQLSSLELLATPCWLFDVRRCQWIWGNRAALDIWRAESRDEMRRREVRSSQSDAVYEHLNALVDRLERAPAPHFEWMTLEPLGIPRRFYMVHRLFELPDSSQGLLSEAAIEPPAEEIIALAANASLTLALFDRSGTQVSQNPAFRKLFGKRYLRLHLSDLLPERGSVEAFVEEIVTDQPTETEVSADTVRGRRWYRVEHRRVRASDGKDRTLSTLFDITETRLEREELKRLATIDGLTGVLNRLGLLDEAQAWVDRGEPFQVLYVDLDGLKRINDVFGHSSGDSLLQAAAERIRRVAVDCSCGRVGGDEFVILAPQGGDYAERVRLALSRDFQLNETHFRPSASVGVAKFPTDSADAAELIRCADRAMYRSKRQGRDRVTHFHPEIELSFQRAEAIAVELGPALLRGEVRPVVQPIYDLQSGRVIGGEFLARWTSESLGVVRPDEFIPIAEQCGSIHRLGRLMVREAARTLARIRELGGDSLWLSINLSAADLAMESLAGEFETTCRTFGIRPDRLHVELTERMEIHSWKAVDQSMRALASLGCPLFLDDFGTGYASLQWLEALPFDAIKIDKSLVGRLPAPRATEMVKAISSMASSLQLDCIAEGIETHEQARTLGELGIHKGQGYLMARPMEVEDWLNQVRSGSLHFEPG